MSLGYEFNFHSITELGLGKLFYTNLLASCPSFHHSASLISPYKVLFDPIPTRIRTTFQHLSLVFLDYLKTQVPPFHTMAEESDKDKHPPPAESDHPSDILKRHLTLRTTSNSSNSTPQTTPSTDSEPPYKIIGLGTCGTVFSTPGTSTALKKGKDTAALWNDFRLTNTVHAAIFDTRALIRAAFPTNTIPNTPHCTLFRPPSSTSYWASTLHRFPPSHREPGACFQLDLIFPVPQPVREALIDLYFDNDEPGVLQEAKDDDEENGACLIRIYLGENESGAETYDSLRNFPLRLNMIEELGLDKMVLADEIAIALAVCHWRARVDAMDAEFVLGCTEEVKERRREVGMVDGEERGVSVWLLDFDKSSRIELSPEHVQKYLVPAFLGNDPYYPRPDIDPSLWARFGETYLKASRLVLQNKQVGGSVMELPALFLEKVEAMIEEHEGWDLEKDIVFG